MVKEKTVKRENETKIQELLLLLNGALFLTEVSSTKLLLLLLFRFCHNSSRKDAKVASSLLYHRSSFSFSFSSSVFVTTTTTTKKRECFLPAVVVLNQMRLVLYNERSKTRSDRFGFFGLFVRSYRSVVLCERR